MSGNPVAGNEVVGLGVDVGVVTTPPDNGVIVASGSLATEELELDADELDDETTCVAVGVGVRVSVFVGVAVRVDVFVDVGVRVGVLVDVPVDVGVDVCVGVAG